MCAVFVRCLCGVCAKNFAHTWSVWKMKIIKCAINQKVTIWEWWKWSRKLLLGYLSTLVRSKVKASFWPGIAPTWQLASAEKGGPISLTLPKQSKEVSPLWLFCLIKCWATLFNFNWYTSKKKKEIDKDYKKVNKNEDAWFMAFKMKKLGVSIHIKGWH